ncbi:hypothetical protein [Ferruginibacter sp. SUN106]|uniref:hypothetical protein n=1 Tax=Ferruginibacter sp. SUN106 TaxID=2978348 RepID=UPI003D360BA3
MDYIEPLPTCDKILELFTPQVPAGFSHSSINNALGYKNSDPEGAFVLAALHKLTTDKYLVPYAMDNSLYKVSGDTFIFKASGGYKGLVEKEKRVLELKEAIEQLGLKSTQSVIDTNTSIQALNKLTSDFYEKQDKYSRTQRGLTYAIVILYQV